ncbi:hypothetical protein L211DRAFT_851839 [Terfezia boudieri ATCC MYA-4762]|uniref:CCHC-type domain-containing protein n=1 Tax=Terfezia boudieri ATCC MYA-4762 TaxID=1051890 RepID=A0A3N4LE06_9PEZI|nr:hypothetical protein L211DRAFT_851839 [Terfezia boudieri ATCC MYA-4762]
MIDAQVDEAYKFPEVLKVYEKCTKSLRKKELAARKSENPGENIKSDTELMLETVKQNQQMVYQVGELLKEMHLAKQAERTMPRSGGYQPIVGSVGQEGATNRNRELSGGTLQRGYGREEYGSRGQYRPRNDIVCYNCGMQGHKVYDCRSQNPLPREEQERLRNLYPRPYNGSQSMNLGQAQSASVPVPAVNPPTKSQRIPQLVTVVNVSDEELGLVQEMDPTGMVTMAAQMVEVIQKDHDSRVHIKTSKNRCLH